VDTWGMRGMRAWLLLWVALASGSVAAQTAQVVALTGTVTGRLTFAETQLPARFAEVVLVRKPDAEDLLPYSAERLRKQQQSKVQKVVSMSGRSGLDGSYTIAEVPPGDYFAIAKLPGYVVPVETPASEKEAHDIDKLTVQSAAAEGPWELGVGYSPLEMALQSRMNAIDGGSGRGFSGVSDDEGCYRIAGLPPGKYLVSAMVHTGGGYRMVSERGGIVGRPVNGVGDAVMTVYVPGAVHKTDATVFAIRGDERIADADIELNLSGLHSVRGRVLAKEDRHVPNNVSIELGVDGDKEQPLFTSVDTDGSFHFDDVPQGTYSLQVHAFDFERPEPSGKEPDDEGRRPKMLHRYAVVKMPVIVAEHDVTMDDFLLAVSTAKDVEDDEPE